LQGIFIYGSITVINQKHDVSRHQDCNWCDALLTVFILVVVSLIVPLEQVLTEVVGGSRAKRRPARQSRNSSMSGMSASISVAFISRCFAIGSPFHRTIVLSCQELT
jgi:hypothetical protein